MSNEQDIERGVLSDLMGGKDGSACPPPGQLLRLTAGLADFAEKAQLEQHVRRCGTCGAAVLLIQRGQGRTQFFRALGSPLITWSSVAVATAALAIALFYKPEPVPQFLAAARMVDLNSERAGGEPQTAVIAGQYKLVRPFLFVRLKDATLSALAQDFLGYVLSSEGQAAIASASQGYLPLRPKEAAAERAKLD